MEITTTKCDVCGKREDTEDYNEPKGWYSFGRQGDRNKDFWARRRDICDECGLKMMLHAVIENGDVLRAQIPHFMGSPQEVKK